MRRLTHLNALRAFESAARHHSFALAAQELSVTPAAISQQIKTLEDYLDVKLFRRVAKGVVLSETGQAMLPELREGFDRLAAGLARAVAAGARTTLVVSLTPSVAAKWLMPRLERFTASHPAIEIRLDTTTRLVEFAREQVDVALRYGSGHWPGLVVTPLMTEEAFPVCSPRLLQGRNALRRVGDLRKVKLIHDASMPVASAFPQWPAWLEAAGVSGVDPKRGLHLNASMLAIQAAIEGQGVALGRSVLVADDLATGRLVRPFNLTLPLKFGYYIVHPRKPAQAKAVAAFCHWLKTEAQQPAPGQAAPLKRRLR
ncbi:MAG TPA: transcriptional regulator GcvA [Burkholderiaceae bacterium]|nr:transcriptional regulator GcvA [Burkholderiaceae bacterium]